MAAVRIAHVDRDRAAWVWAGALLAATAGVADHIKLSHSLQAR